MDSNQIQTILSKLTEYRAEKVFYEQELHALNEQERHLGGSEINTSCHE